MLVIIHIQGGLFSVLLMLVSTVGPSNTLFIMKYFSHPLIRTMKVLEKNVFVW